MIYTEKNIWKKIFLITAIIALLVSCSVYYMNLHNLDLAFNFIRLAGCDYVSTSECVDYRNLYITSFEILKYSIILIIVISLLIGFTIEKLRT
jgi:hypothetical protein